MAGKEKSDLGGLTNKMRRISWPPKAGVVLACQFPLFLLSILPRSARLSLPPSPHISSWPPSPRSLSYFPCPPSTLLHPGPRPSRYPSPLRPPTSIQHKCRLPKLVLQHSPPLQRKSQASLRPLQSASVQIPPRTLQPTPVDSNLEKLGTDQRRRRLTAPASTARKHT